MDNIKYIDTVFLSPEQLVDTHIKTRTLNSLSSNLQELMNRITTDNLNMQANTLKVLIEDAYNVSMYKFQFKMFTLAVSEELKILETNINL
jgi:hypothetical protein